MHLSSLLEENAALKARSEELERRTAHLEKEREQFKALYQQMLETNERLARGLLGQKAERLEPNDAQLTLGILAMLLKAGAPAATREEKVREHTRKKPTGRKPLPEHLPQVEIEVLPEEVKRAGLDAFERIGEERSEVLERRPASLMKVCVVRPKFVPKSKAETTKVEIAPPIELPIPRGMAGPGLLAETVVRRFEDHLPLHRQEGIFGRDGVNLARSTICGWHEAMAKPCMLLVKAMHGESLRQSVLLTDSTSVPVLALVKCRYGHYRVVISPALHVTFHYSKRDDMAAADAALKGFKGYLVADAGTVHDHLFVDGTMVEVGCWSHCRRYFFKSVASDGERARRAISIIAALFALERQWKGMSDNERLKRRREHSAGLVQEFFDWCDAETPAALEGTPIHKALGYARNQREALKRFLTDGRLPMDNNASERQLRREVLGRKNWLFVGSDDGAETNAVFVSLLASCKLHGVEPWAYLRDLFILIGNWPASRILELAPAYWTKTSQDPAVVRTLERHPLRRFTILGAAAATVPGDVVG